ncbi:MAG: phosphoribosylaminoimidazolesuccinocarboxamide synthase [Candidatus Altiarchaeales archaeon WOR_SM1_86-2]|nr:MAG: phosphoribosylaminoimidazolesuccinocarboxamide synthase [Candidatus Altiarchaeales archaeon WOR_SM1_86-2]
MQLLARGKVKEVYAVSDTELEFLFTDNISVFDKIIPSQIPRKGEVLCRTSAFWFKQMEKLGIRTHFKELAAENRMRVKRFRVIRDYSRLTPGTRDYLIPLECVLRWYNAGSLYKGMAEGKVKPRDAGFPAGHKPRYGEPLPAPLFEVTTKLEEVDRKLGEEEALKISGLTKHELDEIKDLCIRIDNHMDKEVKKRGLMHVDGKKEFAMDENRRITLIDTFGTPDEDRFWDLEKYKGGEVVELSKEFVRKYYEEISYHQALYDARNKGLEEPPIPPLPGEMVEKTTKLYVKLFEKITGEKFRQV